MSEKPTRLPKELSFSPHLQRAPLFADEPFVFESGASLSPLEVGYEAYGTLNAAGDNAVLVCHALTGDTHVASHDGDDDKGWWEPLVGPGALLDTSEHFVICPNIVGSCYGSSGPNEVNPATGEPWGERFPYPTVRDVVRSQKALLDHLGVQRLRLVIGGSLGGQQVLQWAVEYPEAMDAAVAIACDEKASAWVIALQDVGRQAIASALAHPQIPELLDQALATARMLAMISYRTPVEFNRRFERLEVNEDRRDEEDLRYEVESYLRYQGRKLVGRFEAHAYLRLTRLLDSFDISRGYGSVEEALSRIRCPLHLIGIDTDVLFHPEGPRRLAGMLRNLGIDARFSMVRSLHGHDAFLMEFKQIEAMLRPWLAEVLGLPEQS